MFNHNISRYSSGIVLIGNHIKLYFVPNEFGKISVDVSVESSVTDFACAVCLTSEKQTSFCPGEIHIDDNAITCMAASEIMTTFREGFICLIEPGMAPLLRDWLPRLECIARISGGIYPAAHQQLLAMEPPAYLSHLYHAIPFVVSLILLDRLNANAAIDVLRSDRLYSGNSALFNALASDAVQSLLVEAEHLASTIVCGTCSSESNGLKEN